MHQKSSHHRQYDVPPPGITGSLQFGRHQHCQRQPLRPKKATVLDVSKKGQVFFGSYYRKSLLKHIDLRDSQFRINRKHLYIGLDWFCQFRWLKFHRPWEGLCCPKRSFMATDGCNTCTLTIGVTSVIFAHSKDFAEMPDLGWICPVENWSWQSDARFLFLSVLLGILLTWTKNQRYDLQVRKLFIFHDSVPWKFWGMCSDKGWKSLDVISTRDDQISEKRHPVSRKAKRQPGILWLSFHWNFHWTFLRTFLLRFWCEVIEDTLPQKSLWIEIEALKMVEHGVTKTRVPKEF